MTANVASYGAHELRQLCETLFRRAGLDDDKSAVVASRLVDADLLGHDTHGLQLCGAYLKALFDGRMAKSGSYSTVSDLGHCAVWDGNCLPGPWLVTKGVQHATEQSLSCGICTIMIRRSMHTACLATYLEYATDRSCMVLVASTSPSEQHVSAHHGADPLFNPAPLAVGIPTSKDGPILIDMALASSTVGRAWRLSNERELFPYPIAVDHAGNPTNDPGVVFQDGDNVGSILPLGGFEQGHKGFALLLWLEAATQGLSGFGRADKPKGWENTVFIQAMCPERLAGKESFLRQTDHLVEICKNSRPDSRNIAVRMPGATAIEGRKRKLAEGIQLHPFIMSDLRSWAVKLGVQFPDPIQ
ncbi:Ldh family oxidoreductase [Bradyrhizobium betae]|uniref:Ldh family oxidoreductase n=1 Tax=Bradyrhizobium betae TaxID=244734 RepID=UPI003D6689F5